LNANAGHTRVAPENTRKRIFAACAASLLAVVHWACANPPAESTTVLASMDSDSDASTDGSPMEAPSGPVALSYRGPQTDGDAFRILIEVSGERLLEVADPAKKQPPFIESHSLELQYRELPVANPAARETAYLLGLDALHYKLMQRNPGKHHEVEIANDKLREMLNGKEVHNLQGGHPKEGLNPRRLLQRVFASIAHDGRGNPKSINPKGGIIARRFLSSIPVRRAIGYSRISFPEDPITPGSVWSASRFPASRTGELGLLLDIEYSLAGFEALDGTQCALILLRSELEARDVASSQGFQFDRVEASLTGTAWVELKTSRVRRMVVEDDIRATFSARERSADQRGLRHTTRMTLERNPNPHTASHWADGSERFGSR
jgi:hypothetical protein